jgi:hypothetical protein
MLSRSWGIPIALHPIRGALLWEQFGRDIFAQQSAAQLQYSRAENRVKKEAKIEFDGLPKSICLYAPTLTSQIIKNKFGRYLPIDNIWGDEDNIIDRIIEFRNHPNTRAYRKYIASIDEVLSSGNIREIRKFVKETDDIATRVVKKLTDGTKMKVKVGFGGIASEKEFNLPGWTTKPVRRRQAFLYRTLSEINTVRSLAQWSKNIFSIDLEEILIKLMEYFHKLN